jgi:hypothetical protein
MASWLWPDHRIGKRESRRLRDEHNATYNALHACREALRYMMDSADAEWGSKGLCPIRAAVEHSRAALAVADKILSPPTDPPGA